MFKMICVWGFCAKVFGLTILDTDYDNEIYDNSKQQIKNRNIRERKYFNSDDGWVLKKDYKIALNKTMKI